MNEQKLKIIFGTLSFILLTMLLFKLKDTPGGMILSGSFLGGMLLIAVIIGSAALSGILKAVFKRISFSTFLFLTTTIAFLIFHYKLYSPTLNIIVPNGFNGEVNLVLSNLEDNVLTIDSNGNGYLNEWTFNETYSRPIVTQQNGKNLNEYLVSYNQSTFFGKSLGDGNAIKSLSFKISSSSKNKEHYNSADWLDKVDIKLIPLENPNKEISNKAIQVEIK